MVTGSYLAEVNTRRVRRLHVVPSLATTGQIKLWRVGGWYNLHVEPDQEPLKLAA